MGVVRWAGGSEDEARRVLWACNKDDLFEPIGIACSKDGTVLVSGRGGLKLWSSSSVAARVPTPNECWPTGVVFDADGRSLYFANTLGHCVMRCSWDSGTVQHEIVAGSNRHERATSSASGSGLHQLCRPFGITLDVNGALLVADSGNHRVVRWR